MLIHTHLLYCISYDMELSFLTTLGHNSSLRKGIQKKGKSCKSPIIILIKRKRLTFETHPYYSRVEWYQMVRWTPTDEPQVAWCRELDASMSSLALLQQSLIWWAVGPTQSGILVIPRKYRIGLSFFDKKLKWSQISFVQCF